MRAHCAICFDGGERYFIALYNNTDGSPPGHVEPWSFTRFSTRKLHVPRSATKLLHVVTFIENIETTNNITKSCFMIVTSKMVFEVNTCIFINQLLIPVHHFVIQLHTVDIVLLKCFVYVCHLQTSDQLRLL